MKSNNLFRSAVLFTVLLLTVSCDQLSKRIVRETVAYNENISLIHPYVTLTKIENPGAFLSLGASLPYPVRALLLTFMPVFALTAALIYLLRKSNLSTYTSIAIAFIVGGGAGNIFDRIVYGSVTDFLHIDFVLFQTGIFNIADVCIMAGMFMILFSMLVKSKKPVPREQ